MKKLYFLTAAAAMLLAVEADGRPQLPRAAFKKAPSQSTESTAKTPGMQLRAAAPAGKWVAKTMVESVPDDIEGWFAITRYTSTYNAQGLPARDIMQDLAGDNDFGYTVCDYEYNENGKNTLQAVSGGATLEQLSPASRLEREYDKLIPGLIVSSKHYSYIDEQWQVDGNCYLREVERNEAGGVTAVVYKTLYQGNYEAVQKFIVTYGSDGKAETITEFQLGYDENYNEVWQEGYSFRDCKWVETDGQLWSLEYIYEDGNKVESFTQYFENEYVGNMTVEYTADGGFNTRLEGDGYWTTQNWTDLENGGFESVIRMGYEGQEDPVMYEVSREEYDIFGNNTFACLFDYYVGEEQPYEIFTWNAAESSYDANGCPVSVCIKAFWPEEPEGWMAPAAKAAPQFSYEQPPVAGEWEDMTKYEYSDFEFVTTTSVGSIEADSNAPVEYFSIDGRKVANPAEGGIYIRRQGGKASKAIVR